MKISGKEESAEKSGYKITLALLLAVVALSSGMKDLSHLQELAGSIGHLTSEWLDAAVTTVRAKSVSSDENCPASEPPARRAQEFRWSGRVASGKAIEIKAINGDINAEPAAGDEIEVLADKKARKSAPSSVRIQVVEHAGGVTICAIYPGEDGNQLNECKPGSTGLIDRQPDQAVKGDAHNRRNNIRNNDVRVDFTVRVPAGVEFVGRTINGEISATSLSSNVESRTVNGSINISTTGYPKAKTVNGEISAAFGNVSWPGALEFKTLNGEVSVTLPATLSTDIQADTFNGEISSEFPLAMVRTVSKKHVSGTIGTGGRELLLKTFNGSINLRRAS